MAPPPSLKRLSAENFEDAEEWFKEMFLPQLNGFLGDVGNALSGALTYKENLLSEEREVTFTTSGTNTNDAAPYPLIIVPQKALRPQNLVITGGHPTSKTATFAGSPWPWWELDAKGNIKIRQVMGLDTSTEYTIRVRFD